jgi:hypothetical protein
MVDAQIVLQVFKKASNQLLDELSKLSEVQLLMLSDGSLSLKIETFLQNVTPQSQLGPSVVSCPAAQSSLDPVMEAHKAAIEKCGTTKAAEDYLKNKKQKLKLNDLKALAAYLGVSVGRRIQDNVDNITAHFNLSDGNSKSLPETSAKPKNKEPLIPSPDSFSNMD